MHLCLLTVASGVATVSGQNSQIVKPDIRNIRAEHIRVVKLTVEKPEILQPYKRVDSQMLEGFPAAKRKAMVPRTQMYSSLNNHIRSPNRNSNYHREYGWRVVPVRPGIRRELQ